MVSARFLYCEVTVFPLLNSILRMQVPKSWPYSRGGEVIYIYLYHYGFMNTYCILRFIIQCHDYLLCYLNGRWAVTQKGSYVPLTCLYFFAWLVLFFEHFLLSGTTGSSTFIFFLSLQSKSTALPRRPSSFHWKMTFKKPRAGCWMYTLLLGCHRI